eukprot:GEMP01082608.1.p3 GENE.GEMP01082608.1~~GEMP01082608.1.p3  ORF type:complete len:103 (+),score=8.29 GEMP01082608.1:548-856(+)
MRYYASRPAYKMKLSIECRLIKPFPEFKKARIFSNQKHVLSTRDENKQKTDCNYNNNKNTTMIIYIEFIVQRHPAGSEKKNKIQPTAEENKKKIQYGNARFR